MKTYQVALDLIFAIEFLFTFGVLYLIGGALVGKFVIEPAVKHMTGMETSPDWSSQKRLQLLHEYRQMQERTGRTRFFYWYIYIGYRFGKLYLILVFLILVAALLQILELLP